MSFLFAFIEDRLAGLCDNRLSQPPREYSTLAPVWIMPMVNKAESFAAHLK